MTQSHSTTTTSRTSANDYLTHYTGSESCYGYLFGIVLTEGAKALAEDNESFWLLDVVCSYQGEKKFKSTPFQVWELFRHLDEKTGEKLDRFFVRATDGDKNILVEQEIPFSDFPHDHAALWFTDNTILLPSEY